MTEKSACRSAVASNTDIHVNSIPFRDIPGQSQLFLRFQADPLSLHRFYPNAVATTDDLRAFAPTVLKNYVVDRRAVCDALRSVNTEINAGELTFEAIDQLSDPNTVAVLTGQQTGLFSGPLYTLYKALSAIKLAQELTQKGTPAVAMFWAATEDHDYDEVSHTSVIGSDDILRATSYQPLKLNAGEPVGNIRIDDNIEAAIDQLLDSLSQTEFTDGLKDSLRSEWTPGERFGTAFLRQIAMILKGHGMIFVDPQNAELKSLSMPILRDTAERSALISERLIARGAELADAGFHEQVLIEEGHFPIFWLDDVGVRTALRRTAAGTYRTKAGNREFEQTELVAAIESETERFSAGVMLRPIVQDFLFPTIFYFGGAAEIAYFGQNSVVYETLDRPVTPILHRQSFTIVEPRHCRTLEKYEIEFADLFGGREKVVTAVAESVLGRDAATLFAEVEESINGELARLDKYFSDTDVTLAENLAKRRRKVLYHIAALRKKAFAAEVRRNGDAERRLDALFAALYPESGLQERSVNILTFLNKYGPRFVDWVFEAVELQDRGHRVIYL